MNEHQASRTLVKSPPELWAECSDASSLTRHLDQFGEIKITKLDPETAVAWEGERASGTVRLEPSGWGTRVTLTAAVDGDPVSAEQDEPVPVAEVAPESVPLPESVPPPESAVPPVPSVIMLETPVRGRGLFARLLAFLGARPEPPPGPPAPPLSGLEPAIEPVALAPEPESEPVAPPEPVVPEQSPVIAALSDAEAALVAALDSLGQAHHRPFSRA